MDYKHKQPFGDRLSIALEKFETPLCVGIDPHISLMPEFFKSPNRKQQVEKIKSFSHGEFNSEDIDKKKIEAKILDNEDIFNRGNVLKRVNLDETFPSFILENKNKFSEWII